MQKFEVLDETPLEEDRISPDKKETSAGPRYVDQKDRYKGDIDPATKLRSGTGIYTYTNPFFQYQGEWVNGKKHGQGTLLMRDGSSFVGEFVDGEINGQGTKTYEDGTVYTGAWKAGERHGDGNCKYGKRNYKELYYNGSWCLGVRSGKGELGLKNGNVIKGNFVDNQPHGECEIKFKDGGSYSGTLIKGVPEGEGKLIKNGFVYKGTFVGGQREGQGVLEIENSTYMLKSLFVKDEPEYVFNRFTCEIISPEQDAAPVETKGKKGKDEAKTATRFTEQEEEQYGANKIYYEFKRDTEGEEGQ
jgi:hypothetical protein